MSDAIAPVLIVGSGPSGLVAALSLRMNGVPVRIIEKRSTYPVGQRGAGLQPRTLEVHHFLGTLDNVYSLSSPVLQMRVFALAPHGDRAIQERCVARWIDPTPNVPYSNCLCLGQSQQEEVLRQQLASYDCQVELDTELQAFEQHDEHVAVTIAKRNSDGQESIENTKYRWLIGADGARGVVRKALGFSFLGETRLGDNLVIGDIHVPNIDETLTKEYWCAWGDMKNIELLLRPTEEGDIANFILAGPGVKDWVSPSIGREDFLNTFYEMTGRTDIQFGDLVWIGAHRPNIRMVEKFGDGRVYLVGDAGWLLNHHVNCASDDGFTAHIHSPTGAQGMNSSIQDSFNLGWKLALVERGLAPQSLLQTYTEERIPVIAEMLKLTTALLNKLRDNQDDAWNREGDLHMLGVNYRDSSIVLDERYDGSSDELQSHYTVPKDQAVRAGDRAPDAPGLIRRDGRETTLFDVFGPTHHTVLIFGRDAPITLITGALERYPKNTTVSVAIAPSGTYASDPAVVVDRDGHAAKGYSIDINKSTIVIVRPDGVIGAITFSVYGLKQYFERIFV